MKPPISPFDLTTLWHGTDIGLGLLAIIRPIALNALGCPNAFAISP